MKQILLVIFVCILSAQVSAIDVVELDNEQDRARYQQLIYELRCPKCQNQNLTDSDSQISEDLRREVARMITEGKSDKEIKKYMVSLYGDFILYRPPVQNSTMLLWAGPVIMVGIGLLIFALIVVNRSRAGVTEGSEGEVAEADIDNTVEALDDAKEVDDQKPEAEMIAEDTTSSESVPETKENLKNEEQN